jgi:hypothetical protein
LAIFSTVKKSTLNSSFLMPIPNFWSLLPLLGNFEVTIIAPKMTPKKGKKLFYNCVQI